MDAGIAMKDFIVATTAGLLNGNVAVMDLIFDEESVRTVNLFSYIS
jgi:ribonuclease PH